MADPAVIADQLWESTDASRPTGQRFIQAAKRISQMRELSPDMKYSVLRQLIRKIGFGVSSETETAAYYEMISEDGRYIFRIPKDGGPIGYGRFKGIEACIEEQLSGDAVYNWSDL